MRRWKNGRHWAVHGPNGALVAVCVYKKGAVLVAGLLDSLVAALRRRER